MASNPKGADKDIEEGGGGEEGKERFTFFYGSDSPFSQHHPCEFKVDGVSYNCAEQYMMHQKAVVFGDDGISARILQSSSPKEQKSLGRKVRNFDDGVWKARCKDIVRTASLAKFRQNPPLCRALLATRGTTLVEASPRDCLWGIGLSASNWKAKDRRHWRGSNWLGETLTQVREEIASDRDSSISL